MCRQGPPDAKLVSSSILPASDRDEIVRRETERVCERERHTHTHREGKRERGDRCVCELAHLHMRVTTNNEYLNLVIETVILPPLYNVAIQYLKAILLMKVAGQRRQQVSVLLNVCVGSSIKLTNQNNRHDFLRSYVKSDE